MLIFFSFRAFFCYCSELECRIEKMFERFALYFVIIVVVVVFHIKSSFRNCSAYARIFCCLRAGPKYRQAINLPSTCEVFHSVWRCDLIWAKNSQHTSEISMSVNFDATEQLYRSSSHITCADQFYHILFQVNVRRKIQTDHFFSARIKKEVWTFVFFTCAYFLHTKHENYSKNYFFFSRFLSFPFTELIGGENPDRIWKCVCDCVKNAMTHLLWKNWAIFMFT